MHLSALFSDGICFGTLKKYINLEYPKPLWACEVMIDNGFASIVS